MKSHSEYLEELRKLKIIEERTLEYLAAVRMAKCKAWVHMNYVLGSELKPHYEALGTPSVDQLNEDVKLITLDDQS